jgi:hypothetical protein
MAQAWKFKGLLCIKLCPNTKQKASDVAFNKVGLTNSSSKLDISQVVCTKIYIYCRSSLEFSQGTCTRIYPYTASGLRCFCSENWPTLRYHRLLCTRIYFTKQKVSKVSVQKVDLPFCSSSLQFSQVAVHQNLTENILISYKQKVLEVSDQKRMIKLIRAH